MITVNGLSYSYKDKDYEFKVYLVTPRLIVLYGDRDNEQMFASPLDFEFDKLPTVFRTLEKIKTSARLHTDGLTDRSKYMSAVESLYAQRAISDNDRKILKSLVKTDTLLPEMTRRQLVMKGYGRFTEKLIFTQTDPKLLKTCEMFKRFVDCIPKDVKYEQSP